VNAWIEFTYVDRARAKGLNFFLHRNIDPADNRSNQHYRDHADNHADDCQERSQFVGAKRGQGQPQVLENVASQ